MADQTLPLALRVALSVPGNFFPGTDKKSRTAHEQFQQSVLCADDAPMFGIVKSELIERQTLPVELSAALVSSRA